MSMKERHKKSITRRDSLKRMGLFMAGTAAWGNLFPCFVQRKQEEAYHLVFYRYGQLPICGA